MAIATPPQQIWFFTGSQDLYGEDTLRQVDEQSRTVLAQLAAGVTAPVEIVWKSLLKNPDSIRRALKDATADDSCIGVITWMHTFSPAKMWIAGLEALGKPLLHLHTQAAQSLPWSSIDMDFMNLNQAAHGDREYAHMVTRIGVPRKIVVGHPTHADVHQRVNDWCLATIGWDTAQRLKVARF
ncbi:MAG: L-arabinose isomerase, partial [Candidatus Nanopelagicales bacterium]